MIRSILENTTAPSGASRCPGIKGATLLGDSNAHPRWTSSYILYWLRYYGTAQYYGDCYIATLLRCGVARPQDGDARAHCMRQLLYPREAFDGPNPEPDPGCPRTWQLAGAFHPP